MFRLRGYDIITKSALPPGLRYAIQLNAKTYLNEVRALQAKTLRVIRGIHWYIRTRDIKRDLKLPKI